MLVAHAQAIHDAGTRVLDDHVGAGGEAQRQLAARIGLEVHHDAALVAVHGQEQGTLAARPNVVERVAALPVPCRRLHLDHVRAHVAQQLRGPGALHVLGEVEDADPGQRTVRGGFGHAPPGWRLRPAGKPASKPVCSRSLMAPAEPCQHEGRIGPRL